MKKIIITSILVAIFTAIFIYGAHVTQTKPEKPAVEQQITSKEPVIEQQTKSKKQIKKLKMLPKLKMQKTPFANPSKVKTPPKKANEGFNSVDQEEESYGK